VRLDRDDIGRMKISRALIWAFHKWTVVDINNDWKRIFAFESCHSADPYLCSA